jgi:predicted transposase YdaD
MNGPEILIPIAFFITIASVVRMVLQHRERRMELDGRGGGAGLEGNVRLERMEQAIDAMAVEIERIAEAQRFTTRLLSERGVAEPANLPPTARRFPS